MAYLLQTSIGCGIDDFGFAIYGYEERELYMAGIAKKTADILYKVIEDIDAVNLKDKKVWGKILLDLEGLISKIPAKGPVPCRFLAFAGKGWNFFQKNRLKTFYPLLAEYPKL